MEIAKRYGGADFAVNYSDKDWQQEVRKITNGRGVDVVYDPVGRIRGIKVSTWPTYLRCLLTVFPIDSLKCIAWEGRAIVVGFAGGEIEKVRLSYRISS